MVPEIVSAASIWSFFNCLSNDTNKRDIKSIIVLTRFVFRSYANWIFETKREKKRNNVFALYSSFIGKKTGSMTFSIKWYFERFSNFMSFRFGSITTTTERNSTSDPRLHYRRKRLSWQSWPQHLNCACLRFST